MKLDNIKWNYDKFVELNLDVTISELIQEKYSEEQTKFRLNENIDFYLKCETYGKSPAVIFVMFMKQNTDDNFFFVLTHMKHSNRIITSIIIQKTNLWHCILSTEQCKYYCTFNLSVTMDTAPSADIRSYYAPSLRLATLHSDTELTDFELRGEDGSVPIHRVVLAAASPVFKNMLIGTWREAKEGRVELPVSTETLRHFKDYLYLGTLPQTGLLELASFAKYCMMPELECQCIQKLGHILTVKSNEKEEEQKSE